MITRLYGTCNGQAIEFLHRDGDIWEATVPRLTTGEYLVNLIAEDDAGNKGYFVDLLLSYSMVGLTMRWSRPCYTEQLVEPQYQSMQLKPFYELRSVNSVRESFLLGEERYVSFEVIPTKSDDDFRILQADWELILKGEVESSGSCRIEGHTISSLVCPKTKHKSYDLVVTYLIGNETLKALTQIEVVSPK
jgi:hypothetical protein